MNYELTSWSFHPHVTAFTTTRPGGYSQGEYGEFNINPWSGDDPEAVRRNRQLLADTLRLSDTTHIILPHQVHRVETYQVRRDYFSQPEASQRAALEGIDIVLTDLPGVCIGVSTADCVPILLYDPTHHAACAIHAGWRGCVQRAIPVGIRAMHEAFGTTPTDLHALIGPHISMERYPVGPEVLDEFAQAGFNIQQFISLPFRGASRYRSDACDDGRFIFPKEAQSASGASPSSDSPRFLLSLSLFCHHELQQAGIPPHAITDTRQCTFDHPDLYFSARRQGISCGRNYTGIIL